MPARDPQAVRPYLLLAVPAEATGCVVHVRPGERAGSDMAGRRWIELLVAAGVLVLIGQARPLDDADAIRIIKPGIPRHSDQVALKVGIEHVTGQGQDPPPIRYRLQDLEVGASYELRISYPATTPARFFMSMASSFSSSSHETLSDALSLPGKKRRRRPRRRLLDTEKIIFTSDTTTADVLITAEPGGVFPSHLAHLYMRPVIYNIVLEKLHLGVPQEAWEMILLCVILVAVSVAIAPWLLEKIVQEANFETHVH